MRNLTWGVGLGVLVFAMACSSSDDDGGSSNSGATGGGQVGGSGGAPAQGGTGGQGATNAECIACGEDSCADALDSCSGQELCGAWLACIQRCGDATCRAGCDQQYIRAEAQYLPVSECLCSSCADECAALSPCDAEPCVDEGLPLMATPPATLAETGLFADDGDELAPYVEHFAPQFELWSDGAQKDRWIYIPKCSQIDTSDMDHWNMPVGTRFWKQFTRDGVRVETRLIHRFGPEPNDWIFAAYQWDDAGNAAVHVPGGVPDASGTQHDIPSEAMCLNCHAKLEERILGAGAIQLSYDVAPGDISIASLSAAGRLTHPAPSGFSVPGSEAAKAALGYMHSNCGNCHNETGVPAVDMKLRLLVGNSTVEETDAWTTAVGKTTTLFQCSGCERIEPGFPDQSAVIQRMAVRGSPAQMPPIGTEIVHEAGVQVVSTWIASLQACSAEGEVCDGNIGCCSGSCVNQVCVESCDGAGTDCSSNGECCTGVCGADLKCACSGDFQPCATNADCCLNATCNPQFGLCGV